MNELEEKYAGNCVEYVRDGKCCGFGVVCEIDNEKLLAKVYPGPNKIVAIQIYEQLGKDHKFQASWWHVACIFLAEGPAHDSYNAIRSYDITDPNIEENFSIVSENDAREMHEDYLIKKMSQQIQQEIDKEILDKLLKLHDQFRKNEKKISHLFTS